MRQVSDYLWRGPRPKSLWDLKNAGFKRVINLQYGFFELFNDDPYENQDASKLDMQWFEIKCSDLTPPTKEQVSLVLKIIADANQNKIKTYIHCKAGVDRTGFMIAAYRILHKGWKFKAAVTEWKTLGRHPWYFWWEKELKKYEK